MMDKEPDDEMDNQPVTEDVSESEGTSRFYRHGGSNQYQPHTNTNRKKRMKSGRHEGNEKIRMRSEAEINSTTATRHSQDEESGIISQEVTSFPHAPSIHIEIKIEISDGYPKTNRNAPGHSRAEEHEDVTTQKATLFQDKKVKYKVTDNSPKLTREAPEPRKADDHKVIIDKEAGQFLEDTEQLVEIMHKVTDGKTEMTREATEHTNTEHDNVISQKVTSILDDTNHQVKIKNNGDGDPKLTTEATNRNDVDEHGDDRQEATFFPADAKQYVEINDEVTSGCPQANTQFPKCSKAEEHKSDNQEVKQFAKSIKTNTENETENCVSLLCAKCGSCTRACYTFKDVVQDRGRQNDDHLISQEATPSPYGPKQHIETNVGITDGYQKTNRDGPRYRRADEHEDDTVQDATLFHENTKEHMTEVIQRNPELTKAASECNKVDITQDTTPTPTDTKPVEIKTEGNKSNPELTREVPEYSSADEHGSLTGVKPDDTKQHEVMRNEVIDANRKLTEETAKQNKANEHDIIGHEPTSFHKDDHGTHLQQEGEQTKKIS
ncbi:interferon-induced very large GTPase 1-like, partial [Clarias magur]